MQNHSKVVFTLKFTRETDAHSSPLPRSVLARAEEYKTPTYPDIHSCSLAPQNLTVRLDGTQEESHTEPRRRLSESEGERGGEELREGKETALLA